MDKRYQESGKQELQHDRNRGNQRYPQSSEQRSRQTIIHPNNQPKVKSLEFHPMKPEEKFHQAKKGHPIAPQKQRDMATASNLINV